MLRQLRSDLKVPVLQTIDNTQTGSNGWARIYWKNPASMLGALVAGIVFALGHHFFYSYLAGRFVDSVILSQAWVNSIATSLAFLTRLMFVLACDAAYAQYQWYCLRRTEHELNQIDTLTGIGGNFLLFADVRTWFRKPMLLGIAIVSWSLPIAAIFTPGTLVVQPMQRDEIKATSVPLIDYNNSKAFFQAAEANTYNQPTVELTRLAMTTATLGEILTIPSSIQNQSYRVQFNGPALRCAISSNQGLFGLALRNKQKNVTLSLMESSLLQWCYMAFVPGDDRMFLSTNMTAYDAAGDAGASFLSSKEFRTLDTASSDSARIYVLPEPIERTALIECQLHNATYNTQLSLNLPGQLITTEEVHYLNPVNATLGTCISNTLGTVTSCNFKGSHPPDHMSYQAIMDAFGHIIAGSQSPGSVNVGRSNESIATSRHLTLVDWGSTESARKGLEELFRNITLSAMSSTSLTSLTVAPNPLDVTIRTYPNAYQYDAKNLLIAYGASMLVSIACTAIGAYAIWLNQASYRNCFSTFIRATWRKNADMDAWITESDRGEDPLLESVGAAKVRFDEKYRPLATGTEAGGSLPKTQRRRSLTGLPSLEFQSETELRLLRPDFHDENERNA